MTLRVHPHEAERASMEPRPFSRGDILEQSSSICHLSCFNGAATFQSRRPGTRTWTWTRASSSLQWSRDLSVAETERGGEPPISSPRLQWSRDLSVAETCTRFNKIDFVYLASMEPRPFSRGDHGNRNRCRRRSARFNGAATFQSRRLTRAADGLVRGLSFNGAATFQSRRRG